MLPFDEGLFSNVVVPKGGVWGSSRIGNGASIEADQSTLRCELKILLCFIAHDPIARQIAGAAHCAARMLSSAVSVEKYDNPILRF